jgi:hypothetical protein
VLRPAAPAPLHDDASVDDPAHGRGCRRFPFVMKPSRNTA